MYPDIKKEYLELKYFTCNLAKGYSFKYTKGTIQPIPLQINLFGISSLKRSLFNLSLTRRRLFLPAKN